ncbi:MAG TPA: xanthine dehydrogenase family protein molybdopterin-binding subunit, partial [Acidimicrobiia bacterium]|nr:xanthine dehydrogenase family protein molybdopterin-binding subunit [Acidimicrobiia bacterium]
MTVVVGTSTARLDGMSKVRGEAVYGVDVSLPGMLHAGILGSPIPAGTIVALDTSKAEAMAGVWAVITASDAPRHRSGLVVADQRIFAHGYVAFEGEPVAAVAAETPELVRKALDAIRFEVDLIPPVVDLDVAVADGARPVHPDWEDFVTSQEIARSTNVCGALLADPDGVDEAFAAADFVIEDEFRAQRQYQAYLEPRGVVALYEADRYTIHLSHQFPFNVRDRLAQALGVTASAIRVVGHHLGGGFGAKLDITIEPYAALLAKRTGRAVRLVLDRTTDLITAPCREDAIIRLRSGVTTDGRIVAREMNVLLDAGAAATDAPYLCSIPFLLAGAPYRVGPTRVVSRAVYTNTAPTGAFRGVSGTHTVFALEQHTDNIADRLGVDRREFRLQSLMSNGDRLLNGQTLDDLSILREAFDTMEAAAPWASLGREHHRGVGIASCVWLTNPMPGSATVKLNEDGTVGVVTGATENGSGALAMGVAQVAAEELGISVDRVIVSLPDTDTSAYDAGSQGSRTTHVVGRAVREAAAEIRRQIFDVASDLLEVGVEDLEIVDGGVGVKGVASSRIPLAEVATTATFSRGPIAATGRSITPQPQYDPTCASGLLFPTMPTPTYHVHVAEVEVDPVTGNVDVLRYLVVQEVGKAINPAGVYGQIQGGVAQGLGYALYEGLAVGEDGRYRQRTLETYRLPLALDVPRVEAHLLEHADALGPYGAKGVAEPPVVPVAAVIASAVSHAVGAPITRIPITPEDVLDA